MKHARILLVESMGIALVFGLVVAGWQTALAADTMRDEFSSVIGWLGFIFYALGGFVLLAWAIQLPFVIIGFVIGLFKKKWGAIPITIYLITCLVGTLWAVTVLFLDIWPLEGLITSGTLTSRDIVRVVPLIFFGYVISYLTACGFIRVQALMSPKAIWSALWGWWLITVTVPVISLKILNLMPGAGMSATLVTGIGIAAVMLLIAIFFMPQIYTLFSEKVPALSWVGVLAVAAIIWFTVSPLVDKSIGEEADGGNPPVILITIDTLRADALTCYAEGGVPRLGSAVIDAVADEGTLFETAFSTAPWTRPSVPSYLAGLPPSAHGAFADERGTLADGATTLAEIFKENGYATGGVVVNSILGPGSGNEQGFDFYVEEMERWEEGRALLFQQLIDRIRLSWPDVMTPNTNPYMETDAVELASEYIRTHSGEKFFLWLHLLAPHQVFYPPEEYRDRVEEELGVVVPRVDIMRQFDMKCGWPSATLDRVDGLLGMYAGEVAFSDDNVGVVIETLKELEIYDDCLVVISSDHGEEFYEHDKFTHGRDLYPEVLHVPLIMRYPGRIESGFEISTPVSLVDLAPTILDLAGIDASLNGEPAVHTGRSLVPLLNGDPFEEMPIFFERPLHFDQELKGVYYEGLYYIGGSDAVLHPRLYDLSDDPGAYFDISRDRPDDMDRMRQLLEEHDVLCGIIAEEIGANMSEADMERLRSLGYIN